MIRRAGSALHVAAILGTTLASSALVANEESSTPTVAFYYASEPPVAELAHFDRVVLEPDNVSDDELARLRAEGVEVLAYLSVGEVRKDRSWRSELPARCVLGENPGWGSLVVDQTSPIWRSLLVDRVATALLSRGFDGLFLDTLDSFSLVAREEPARSRQIDGLAQTILALSRRHPSARLLLNRGFEILPRVATKVSGVVAESLFQGFDPRRGFVDVSEDSRNWLVERLREVRETHGLAVTVIDYLPARERERARSVARQIAGMGFTPWVSTPELDVLGVGSLEVVPRRVLAIHDGRELALTDSPIHLLAATVLEHLGLFVEYLDLQRGLPAKRISGRYVGIVAWLGDEGDVDPDDSSRDLYRDWLARQRADGVPVVLVGSLGVPPTPETLASLGLALVSARPQAPLQLEALDPTMLGFEAEARIPTVASIPPLRSASDENRVVARVRDARGTIFDSILITPWGGIALRPSILRTRHDASNDWILDPFAFFTQALRLPPMPRADASTENGSRILVTHIDGDGAANRAEMRGTPLAMRVILDEVLREFRVPTTVSLIEGEVAATGLHPELTAELEPIAREIFSLPWVETATHAFSHPFSWEEAEREPDRPEHRLPIPGYTLDLIREIVGSATYVTSLAPSSKPARVMLWTGDALPSERALRIAREAGLVQLNGGMTCVTSEHPSITRVTPILRPVGEELQVYAPIMNENVYTGLWTGPFWGFRRVVETFALTNSPRRLKPLNIYYHFYSGSKRASLRALRTVYESALSEEPLPLFASEYSLLATELARITFARTLDGEWRIRGAKHLRTFRCPRELGWPDLERSPAVAALREIPQGRYLSFAAEGERRLRFTAYPHDETRPVASNARITRSDRRGGELRLVVDARSSPTWLDVRATSKPRAVVDGKPVEATSVDDSIWRFTFEGGGPRSVVILP